MAYLIQSYSWGLSLLDVRHAGFEHVEPALEHASWFMVEGCGLRAYRVSKAWGSGV